MIKKGIIMKFKHLMIIGLLLIMTMGAVNASDDLSIDDALTVEDEELMDTLEENNSDVNEDDQPSKYPEIRIDEREYCIEHEFEIVGMIYAVENAKGNVSIKSNNETLFHDDISKLKYITEEDTFYAVKLYNLNKTLKPGKLPLTITYGNNTKNGTIILKNLVYTKDSVDIRISDIVNLNKKNSINNYICGVDDSNYLNGVIIVYMNIKKVYQCRINYDVEQEIYYSGFTLLYKELAGKIKKGKYKVKVVYNPDGTSKSYTKSKNVYFTTPKSVKLSIKKFKIRKSAKKLTIKSTLKINGKKVKGYNLIFKFNKKFYTAKTNKKGVAKITIKHKTLKKLKAGKKVKIKVDCGIKTVKKTVKVYR